MYFKIINNSFKQCPRRNKLSDGRTVSNYNLLPDEILKNEGWTYCESVIEIKPHFESEKQCLILDTYELNENILTLTYIVIDC